MTHRILITLSMFCFLLLSTPVESIGATGQDAKISYVLKNLSLKKDVVAKFRPLLVQYYQEIDKVKDVIPNIIILTSPIVRIYFKKLIDQFIPNITVLSYSEIDNTAQIQAIGNIAM